MQDLASWVDEDPQRADTPEYEQKLKDVQKFSEGIAEMPLGKLEAAISNYSLEKEIEGRRFAQDMEARRLGIAEGTRADAVEDRETKREREAAFAKGLQLLGQVPTTKTEKLPVTMVMWRRRSNQQLQRQWSQIQINLLLMKYEQILRNCLLLKLLKKR